MTPPYSEYCTSLSVKSSRLIGAVTFLALVQSRLTCVNLTCSPRSMMLKYFLLFFLICSRWLQHSVYVGCTDFFPCKRICVGCTDFRVRIRLVRSRRLVRMNTSFARKATHCVRIQLVRYRRIVRMNTSFARKATFSYVYHLCTLSGLCVQIHICA